MDPRLGDPAQDFRHAVAELELSAQHADGAFDAVVLALRIANLTRAAIAPRR